MQYLQAQKSFCFVCFVSNFLTLKFQNCTTTSTCNRKLRMRKGHLSRARNSLTHLSSPSLMLSELMTQGSGSVSEVNFGDTNKVLFFSSFPKKMCLFVLDQVKAVKAVRAWLLHKLNLYWETAAWFPVLPHSRATATP